MISIIICSREKSLLDKIEDNINETIGVAHEVITINNSDCRLGICAAYNEGARKSKYDFLIFVHEDVFFLTSNWGNIIIKNLQDKFIGLLGVAGAVIKTNLPTSWVDVPQKYHRVNAVAAWGRERKTIVLKENSLTLLSEVAVLDGMFLCMRKEVWRQFPFDEKMFTKFDLYDLDISMAISERYKLFVTHEILIEHFSAGKYSLSWYKDSKLFVKKWRTTLPKTVIQISTVEHRTLQHFSNIKQIDYLIAFRQFNLTLIWSYLQLFWYRPLSRLNLIIVFRGLKKLLVK
ncbi:MAG: hypothetical protein JST69_00750 [Bacteroidetes bacterium]|nr:hypothetical protein [Bacteroidota bacterium]